MSIDDAADQRIWRRPPPGGRLALPLSGALLVIAVIAAAGPPLLAAALALGLVPLLPALLRSRPEAEPAVPQVDATLEAAEPDLHQTFLSSLSVGVMVLDSERRTVFANEPACEVFECTPAEALGLPPGGGKATLVDEHGREIPLDLLPSGLAAQGRTVEDMVIGVVMGKRRRWTTCTSQIVVDERSDRWFLVLTIDDVTAEFEERQAAAAETAQLRHRALHDSLTGLPNRTLLMDRLSHAKLNSSRRGAATGLLVIDLDGFKEVNDTLGHAAGDEVLVQVAVRLRTTLRASDTAARLGGDEFVVLCEDLHPAMADLELVRIRERVQALLNEPYTTTCGPADVGASVGWAIAQPGDDLDLELVVAADESMMADKRARKQLVQADRHSAASLVVDDSGWPRMRVVIVDDDPAMRLLAARILESSSSKIDVVGEAYDGESAVKLIGDLQPDLVLCDVMMPGMSGPQVVAAVRQENPQQPFIFWSATSAPELEQHEREMGVPFVLKDRIEELPVALMEAAPRARPPRAATHDLKIRS